MYRFIDSSINFPTQIEIQSLAVQISMFRHRKRLILKRLRHLIRLRRLTDERVHEKLLGRWIGQNPSIESLELSLPSVPEMTALERKILRRLHKNLPPYVFMTEPQKQQYFRRKTAEYKRLINISPQRVSKSDKAVKFDGKVEVRPFMGCQRVKFIQRTESIQEVMEEEQKHCMDI